MNIPASQVCQLSFFRRHHHHHRHHRHHRRHHHHRHHHHHRRHSTIIAIIIIIIIAAIIIIISIISIIIIIILSPLPLWLRRLRGCRRSSGPQSQLRIRARGTSRHPPPRWLDSWGPVGCWGCRLLQVELPFIIGTIYIVDCWVIVVKVQIVAGYYCYTSLSISCLIPSGKLT